MADRPTPTSQQQEAAYKLVGEFMFHWAFIESRITQGLQKLLRLPHPQGEIVLANVGFRDKTSMLSTLADYILGRMPTQEAATAARKLVNSLVEFNSNYRNVLAHNSFVPLASEKGGVEILRVKAKGKFEMPETVWDHNFFEERFKETDQFERLLETLFETLEAGATVEDAARALLTSGALEFGTPTGSFFWPGVHSRPPLHPSLHTHAAQGEVSEDAKGQAPKGGE